MPIRNFGIIAHIDHGKSTLADRMLEITGTLEKREMKVGQVLDSMDIEQERGITIKLTPVRMNWKGHQLNLIDTPGHVDFQYEVSRSLASVEWVVLVVDATQGVEAQTLSNLYLAIEYNLTIIPVLNKIDLPSAQVDSITNEIISLIGCKKEEIICVSAKFGTNVEQVLNAIIERIPEPKIPQISTQTRGIIFDSQYDSYRWVVIYTKLIEGSLKRGDKVKFLHTDAHAEVLEVGCFRPGYEKLNILNAGEIGYVISGVKNLTEAQVGDTIYLGSAENPEPIAGFKKVAPFVFAGMYPVDTAEYELLRVNLEKLKMNDASLTSENEVSPALGHGFRCWFLGLLHMEIVKERLDREFELDVIMTSPQATYRVMVPGDKRTEYRNFPHTYYETREDYSQDNQRPAPSAMRAPATVIFIRNPEDLPLPGTYMCIEEPIGKLEILVPTNHVWAMMELCDEKRGAFIGQNYIDSGRVMLIYEVPIAEIITDFHDEMKARSSGYASMNYEFLRYQEGDLLKLDILVHGERISAFSQMVHSKKAFRVGSEVCKKLKDQIPKQNFSIAIQAAVGNKVLARETISAYRKDVTGYLYGGDVTRKKKLLEKQKKGKKRMKQFGKVSIPSETFVEILKK